MSASRLAALALTAGIAAALSACGRADEPLRVGILAECTGLFAPTAPGALAGASLPLLGSRRREGRHLGEVEDARVAGRRVELIPACTEVTRFSQLIAETRWLVESRGADVVVGPLGTPDGVVMRELAHRYPDVTFLAGSGVAQEVDAEGSAAEPLPAHARRRPDRRRARGLRVRRAGVAPRDRGLRGIHERLGDHRRVRRGVLRARRPRSSSATTSRCSPRIRARPRSATPGLRTASRC